MTGNMPRVAVVGLGYVGLPLAVALAEHGPVDGYDADAGRIAELQAGRDRTGEIEPRRLAASALACSADPRPIRAADIVIVTVPTPVTAENRPDLSLLLAACRTVGRHLKRGTTVVFESTVYPGVTEDICGPALAEASGLVQGRDFNLGYSPERINPGDREHTVERIAKVVAGDTPEVAAALARLYGRITSGGIFLAASIKAAEAAKAIENAQRDINIAFINEVTMIFNRLGLSVHDVLAAARTKWNFLPFTPGLVGGHCIGVDPYYLADCAERLGHVPEIILAGRRINDGMSRYVARSVADRLRADGLLGEGRTPRLLVLGLTFKEDVPDLRNSKVADLVAGLRAVGAEVDLHDPVADPAGAAKLYGSAPLGSLPETADYDGLLLAVPHRAYRARSAADLAALLREGGLFADLKGLYRAGPPAGRGYWSL